MRILMAALVVCLGMVGVHAAAHHEIKKDQTTSGGRHGGTVTPGGGGHHLQSTGASGPAPRVDYRNSQQVLFKWIKPGTFEMGSPSSEPDRRSDEVQHTVQLTRGFWLSDHEVTQGEYLGLMGNNPSYFQGDPNRPVEMVTWYDAIAYCDKLTTCERSQGKISGNQAYRLPTEAEWEYAARAGTTGARHGELDAIAWWNGNSGLKTHAVKGKQANRWGLYDMMGNVDEWCSDWYEAYPTRSVTDPTVAALKDSSLDARRVFRGGSWPQDHRGVRSAARDRNVPGDRYFYLGFRPALSSVR